MNGAGADEDIRPLAIQAAFSFVLLEIMYKDVAVNIPLSHLR